MAVRTAGIDRNEEITSLSPYVYDPVCCLILKLGRKGLSSRAIRGWIWGKGCAPSLKNIELSFWICECWCILSSINRILCLCSRHPPPSSVGDGIMFLSCPSVRPFVRSSGGIVTTVSHERLEQSRWTYREYSLTYMMMTWLDSGSQRSKIKVTTGRQDGEGIHVDAGSS